jgi:hypothetical protein
MLSSMMLRRVASVKTDASAELNALIIMATKFGDDVGVKFPETSVLTRAIQRIIPEDGNLHSHRRENLKSYIALTVWTL